MYAEEHKGGATGGRLVYKCKHCSFSEESDAQIVFKVSYKTESQYVLYKPANFQIVDPACRGGCGKRSYPQS